MIVADFHSAESAQKAAEDWSRQFQKHETPENVEEIPVQLSEVAWSLSEDTGIEGINLGNDIRAGVKLDRVLVKCGLADSGTDAARKLKQGAVRVNDAVAHSPRIKLSTLPAKLTLRVGKKLKIAVIS